VLEAVTATLAPFPDAFPQVLSDDIKFSIGFACFRFLSTVEAYRYPVYAFQFHPEAVQFDWTKSARFINRSVPSIAVASYLANFWVRECRKYVSNCQRRTIVERISNDQHVAGNISLRALAGINTASTVRKTRTSSTFTK
jgi:hypothetical protein